MAAVIGLLPTFVVGRQALAEWDSDPLNTQLVLRHHYLCGLNDLPEGVRMAIRNQGGGHLNHSMFWLMMAKNGGGDPKGDLAIDILPDITTYLEKS